MEEQVVKTTVFLEKDLRDHIDRLSLQQEEGAYGYMKKLVNKAVRHYLSHLKEGSIHE